MQLSDVSQLIKLLDKSSLTEISFSDEKSKVVLKKESYRLLASAPMAAAPTPAPAPIAAPTAPAQEAHATSEKPNPKLKEITSPMVGTFFASPSPGAEPFVQAGSPVKPGQVLCIIEAMKIMNEIESDVAGVIEEVCAPSETPVEYGTVLFRVRMA